MTAAVAHRVVLGCVPDPELSPNARVHRMVRARKVRQLREYVGWAARETAPSEPIRGPVVVTVTIGWPKRRPGMDVDNATACLKAVLDGIVDAGYLEDDSQMVELRVRQQRWGEWSNQGGWLYPDGVMTVDIEAVGEGE